MNRDEIICMAREAGFYIDQDWIEHGLPGFERFANLVAADEREACAKLCEADGLARGEYGYMLTKAAAQIRARGES